MESSRRAVEAYWRSRMIDTATADDDKITPIYKMDEICETLRSSPFAIVKEMSDYVLKRLDHKSPRVKQKALRLIKYSVSKAGVEFRREMQRHSGVIRQMFHYRGEPDALRGDALNKAVRDTAHEVVAAIFAAEEKQTTSEDVNKRIQGFGNTNFEMPLDDRKSFLSEVVELGSASIRQGLNIIGGQSNNNYFDAKGNPAGSYRGPSLRKSLTSERDTYSKHQREGPWTESPYSMGSSEIKDVPPSQDYRVSSSDLSNEKLGPNQARGSSREERLLDSITTVGGVRLQPSREAIQRFLSEASKLDCNILSTGICSKLHSNVWQVRLKAMCVLESMLRQQREDNSFETLALFFQENKDVVVACLESPQASLREKANRVLALLGGSPTVNDKTTILEKPNGSTRPVAVEMPDLIDTGEIDLLATEDISQVKLNETTSSSMVDLLGESIQSVTEETNTLYKEEDPFAGLSIHTDVTEGSNITSNLFSGLVVGADSEIQNEVSRSPFKEENSLFSDFSQSVEQNQSKPPPLSENLDDLFSSLSVSQPFSDGSQQRDKNNAANVIPNDPQAGLQFLQQNHLTGFQAFSTAPSSQMMGGNPPLLSSVGPINNFPQNMMMPQMFPLQSMNFGPIGNPLAQQQLLAAMANLQRFGMGVNSDSGGLLQTDSGIGKGSSRMYPDGFDFSSDPLSSHVLNAESSRKEEKTRAFDFIADHISAAKNVKKVT